MIRFWRLSRERRVLVVAAALLQLVARAALMVAGLPRAVRAASYVSSVASVFRRTIGPSKAGPHRLENIRWALAVSAARVGGTCLTQAIAARVLIDMPSQLIVGVRTTEDARATRPSAPRSSREFHAWLEAEGLCVPATPVAGYTPLRSWS